MKRGFSFLLLAAVFLLMGTSCESDLPAPVITQDDLSEEIQSIKDVLDQEILDVIRETGKPFDWNEASDDMIFRAILVTGYPIVVGYLNHVNGRETRDELLSLVYESEGVNTARLGELDEVLAYKEDLLGFFHVNIKNLETISQLRKSSRLGYIEMAGYPILLDEMAAFYASEGVSEQTITARNMVLDPYQESPDYFSQVSSYSGSAATTMRRHNVDHVYRDYEIYGENIGIAVFDNGILPEHQPWLLDNGYGEREFRGYYNPLWFIPGTEPDGPSPQSPDLLFISQIIEGQWEHGWQQNRDVLIASPNSKQYAVRVSPMVLILVPSQILGVINSILAMAQDPDIRIVSMANGSLFRIHQMEGAINYFHSQDKIMVAAAGTSLPILRELLGVVHPASYEPVIAATGIENREETGGTYVLGSSSHGGPEVDVCIERNSSSSGATSKFAGMLGLIWSANPELSRDEIMEIVVQSTDAYQQYGEKDPRFGWGTPDVLWAVEEAMSR